MKKLNDASTEEKIMEAAKAVFMKYGLYGARMQDIADTAGINKALLHYYFRNKEKLFDKVFDNALERFFRQMDVFDNDMPLKQRIFMYVDNMIDFYAEYPQMSMFILKEMGNNPEMCRQKIMAAKKNKQIRFISLIEEAIKKGEIGKNFDTTMFMINLQSLCSYPFLASPMLKNSVKAQGKDWDTDFSTDKLKKVVKQFIENVLE